MDVLASLNNLGVEKGRGISPLSSAVADRGARSSDQGFSSALKQSQSEVSKNGTPSERRDEAQSQFAGNPPSQKLTPDRGNVPTKDPRVGSVDKKGPLAKDLSQEQIEKNIAPGKPPVVKDESVDSIPRRIALQNFLRKMKEEVGVEATDIMAAFAGLSLQEMVKPPEQNIDKILGQLNLSTEQQATARGLFEDLLQQTTTNSFADYLKGSGRQLSLQVMSERELRNKSLEESLKKLNDQFFLSNRPPHSKQQEDGQAIPLMAGKSVEANASGTAPATTQGEASSGLGTLLGFGALAAAAATVSQSASSGAQTAATTTAPDTPFQEMDSALGSHNPSPEGVEIQPKSTPVKTSYTPLEDQLRSFKLPELPSLTSSKAAQSAYDAPIKGLSKGAGEASSESAKAGVTAAAGVAGAVMALGALGGEEDAASEEFSNEFFDQPEAVLPAEGQKQTQHVAGVGKFEIGVQPTSEEESQNIRELINQAQFMVKKGGGEMKVALNPEGLGEVAMKVAVDKGQVQVEMITESDEAKKILEKGLGELKATLASHKLNVENIKVELQGDISKHMDQQRQDAERQMAHQFMENFRQENGAWRRSFYDIPGAQGYKGQTEESSAHEANIKTSAQRKGRADRRLDLVA